MMQTCQYCFHTDASPIDLVPPSHNLGTCELCGRTGVEVWPATAWADAFAGLLNAYVPETDPDLHEHAPLQVQLQTDWKLFAFEDDAAGARARRLLEAIFPDGHPLLATGLDVRPNLRQDHVAEWSTFAEEVTERNRFFPASTLDLDFLREVIEENLATIPTGTPLYRARPSSSESPLSVAEMGAPPPRLATAGRANPMGIPHLYVSFEEPTCVHECRAPIHSFVTVAKFEVNQPLVVLNLGRRATLNPFKYEDEELAEGLDYSRLLRRLGNELSRPVRASDSQLEYVPTQYLSDFVKSLGYDGIRYSSSLRREGSNVVLFDRECIGEPAQIRQFEISSYTLDYRETGNLLEEAPSPKGP